MPLNGDRIHLTPNEHFYTQREFKIIVNACIKETPRSVGCGLRIAGARFNV